MSFTKLTTKLDLPRLYGKGQDRYTDTNEFLSPGVLIAYKARPGYPTQAMKVRVDNAAIQARNIVRLANDELARVVIQRKKESKTFTDTMKRHFNLDDHGGTAGGFLEDNQIDKPFSLRALMKRDRRWVLEQIRQDMLSLSFHLNTGIYLFAIDDDHRTVDGGITVATGNNAGTRGYVWPWHRKNSVCGFRMGEIHISFEEFLNTTLNSNAKTIIHEAAHKYLSATDFDGAKYAYYPGYPPSLDKCLKAADCFAWTAVSLATGGLKMPDPNNTDHAACQGTPL